MIIGVTGATKVGKSTFINDFRGKYGRYVTPEGSYRDIPNLDLYENGTEESQRVIRDFMFDQIKEIWAKRDTTKRVIMDRSLLDNLACTLYLYAKGDIISDEFLAESFEITKKSMGMYHLIYFIPISDLDTIEVPDDISSDFRMSFDTILKTVYNAYLHRDDLAKDIFPETKATAIDMVEGSRVERLDYVSEILDDNGDVLGGMGAQDEPLLYDKDGRDLNMSSLESDVSLEDFGFSQEEIKKV